MLAHPHLLKWLVDRLLSVLTTLSEVVAESAVDTFAKVVGGSAVAFAEAWAISMIGGTTPGA